MLGADGLTADDLAGIVTHADFGATPAPGDPRPMVVLAPGGGSFVDLSTALAEHLASHGYVVVTVQPDAAAESLGDQSAMLDPDAAAAISEALDEARRSQLSAAIELADDPLFERLVGPVDATRIAVGGHSYGGSTAFDAALVDDRIAAAFDLDGALFGPAGATPLTMPSLVVMADLYGALHGDVAVDDPGIADVLASTERVLSGAPATVSVGLVDATHYDVTDLPAILSAVPAALAAALAGGPIGRQGTIDTQIIVQRFLDAALAETPRLPSGEELVAGLPMTDPHPLPG